MSAGEIGRTQPVVRHDDVAWLVRRGLVEARKEGATFYRPTAAGMRTEGVDEAPSPAGRVELVEARVLGEAGPTVGPRRKPALGSGSRGRSGSAGRQRVGTDTRVP